MQNFDQTLNELGDIDAEITAEQKLQDKVMSISAYSAEFLQIISCLDWHEKNYISIYISGLKCHVKDELAKIDWPQILDKALNSWYELITATQNNNKRKMKSNYGDKALYGRP